MIKNLDRVLKELENKTSLTPTDIRRYENDMLDGKYLSMIGERITTPEDAIFKLKNMDLQPTYIRSVHSIMKTIIELRTWNKTINEKFFECENLKDRFVGFEDAYETTVNGEPKYIMMKDLPIQEFLREAVNISSIVGTAYKLDVDAVEKARSEVSRGNLELLDRFFYLIVWAFYYSGEEEQITADELKMFNRFYDHTRVGFEESLLNRSFFIERTMTIETFLLMYYFFHSLASIKENKLYKILYNTYIMLLQDRNAAFFNYSDFKDLNSSETIELMENGYEDLTYPMEKLTNIEDKPQIVEETIRECLDTAGHVLDIVVTALSTYKEERMEKRFDV